MADDGPELPSLEEVCGLFSPEPPHRFIGSSPKGPADWWQHSAENTPEFEPSEDWSGFMED